MKRQLTEAWGGWLSQFLWAWFVTLTFRDWVNSFHAHRLFEQLMRKLEKAAGKSKHLWRLPVEGDDFLSASIF